MSDEIASALTPEEWTNRALWRPGSDAEFDSGALWASEVLPEDFPALIALVNSEAGLITREMVDQLREAAALIRQTTDAGGAKSNATLADALRSHADTLESILPPRSVDA